MNAFGTDSPREIVRATLGGQTPPHTLCGELFVDADLVRAALGWDAEVAVPLPAEKALIERWRHDLVTVPFSNGWGSGAQPDEDDSYERVAYWHEESDLFVFALIDGPFSLVAKTWGWEQTLMRLAKNNAEIRNFLADSVLELGDQLATIAANGGDGVIVGDDIAFRRGPYMRPEQLRQTYFPYLTLLVLSAQELGLPIVFHSDGNLWPIWQDLLHTGIVGVHGLDPFSAMSLELARERSGPRLCLWGNLDLHWLTQAHTPDQTRETVQNIIAPMQGSPFIFGTCGGLPTGLPLAQLDRLYTAVQAFPWPRAH